MSASMFDFCSFTHQFKLNFLETENVAIGRSASSEVISAGGHLWRIDCCPNGDDDDGDHVADDDGDGDGDDGNFLSVYLHESESEGIKAIFEAFVMDKGSTPSSHRKRLVHVFQPKDSYNLGWRRFVKRSVLESLYLTNGCFIIMCGVKVEQEDELLKSPPSDIGSHLGLLLDCTDGSDVTFIVDGEKFPAHRAVLAARSPVFKAQLLGSMADAKMPSITLHDISPVTFKVMLRFIYTDAFPKDDELGDSRDDIVRHLLAAADRFALDRLKILCAADLGHNMSVDIVAATLICAEAYNCPQLKKDCIDFIAKEKNFKKVVLTDGFFQLGQQFPSIITELKLKVGA